MASAYGVACFVGGLFIVREKAARQARTRQVVTAMILALGLAQFGHLFAQNLVDAAMHTLSILQPSFFRTAQGFSKAVAHETQRGQAEAHYNWFTFFIVVAVSPVFEELIFRGTLQRIVRRRFGPRVALLTSAIAFSIAHAIAYPTSFFQHLGLGLGFATAFELAGGDAYAVIAPIAGHVLWNVAATFVTH
jgi:membrane protease YdiL (CAAX protease family)